jgi:hypothetical protein
MVPFAEYVRTNVVATNATQNFFMLVALIRIRDAAIVRRTVAL